MRKRDVMQDELLCRVGYPFSNQFEVEFVNDEFVFKNVLLATLFANEAFVSRFVIRSTGRWIETSSPGLAGQSGVPLICSNGFLCGIQVNTAHYPLGFTGTGKDRCSMWTGRLTWNDKGITYQTNIRARKSSTRSLSRTC